MVSQFSPPEHREVVLWAIDQREFYESKECGPGAEISVGSPLRGRLVTPDRVDTVYPLYCEHKYEVCFGSQQGTPGEPDYRECSQLVEMSDSALYLAVYSDEERSLSGPYCKSGQGYESSGTCAFKDSILQGGAGFLDLLVMVDWESSDAGSWASVTPVHLSGLVARPDLTLPDNRQAYGFNQTNLPAVRINKNVMIMDLRVSCNAKEQALYPECSESKRYRVRYERGVLHVRELGK
jgi:hypothetical protein